MMELMELTGPGVLGDPARGDWAAGGPAPELRGLTVLRDRKLGRGESGPAPLCAVLCRGQGGAHRPLHRPPGVRPHAGIHRESVPSIDLDNEREGAGHVPLGQGEPDHPRRQGRRGPPASGDEAGRAAEEGEEGAVDGLPVRARLGQERELPHPHVRHSSRSHMKSPVLVYVIDYYSIINV